MDIKIISDIKDLLMEDSMVIVPGLGGFTSTYKPAVTDGVMGVLHPPSYHLTFDSNQQTNDGKLIDYLREKYKVSSTVAQEYIDAFVKETQSNFDKNEIVTLPEIGRLYRDFTQKIQFLPEATNFNADTYGLSSIRFSPISRGRREPVKEVPEAPAIPQEAQPSASSSSVSLHKEETKSPEIDANKPLPSTIESLMNIAPPYKERVSTPILTPIDNVPPPSVIDKHKEETWLPNNWRNYAPVLAVSLVGLLALLVWFNTGDRNTEKTKKLENGKPNVNVNPHTDGVANTGVATNNNPPQQVTPPPNVTDSLSITNDQFFNDKQKQQTTASTPPPVVEPTPPPVVEKPVEVAPPPAAASHKVVIVIGGFANKANIGRLKKWITGQGYSVYEKRKGGGITEIGCTAGYETTEEFNKIVNKVKARYGNEIAVYRK